MKSDTSQKNVHSQHMQIQKIAYPTLEAPLLSKLNQITTKEYFNICVTQQRITYNGEEDGYQQIKQ